MVMSTMITITVTIMKAMITTVLVITITMTIIKEKKIILQKAGSDPARKGPRNDQKVSHSQVPLKEVSYCTPRFYYADHAPSRIVYSPYVNFPSFLPLPPPLPFFQFHIYFIVLFHPTVKTIVPCCQFFISEIAHGS